MKLFRLRGGTLSCFEEPSPAPGPGEVLVTIRTASVNARDLGILGGAYPNRLDLIPLSDGAGVVTAMGVGVSDFAAGDSVISCFYPCWEAGPATTANHAVSLGCEADGVLAEQVILPASALVAKPATLDFAAAATLPCAGLTAWTALFSEGGLRPGQDVLILGTGGVALFALQFAQMAGARTIMTSRSPAKLERARKLGLDVGITVTDDNWPTQVRAATRGKGVDLVLELGGASLAQSVACTRTGGRIALIGVRAGLGAQIDIGPILFGHIHMTGITVGHRSDFVAMNRAITQHGLAPVIDRTFAFDDAPAAYAALSAGDQFGKVAITF